MNDYLDYLMSRNFQRSFYIIGKRPESGWYLKDIELAFPHAAYWTNKQTVAKIFFSEKDVEDFKFQFLHNRYCEVIRLTKP